MGLELKNQDDAICNLICSNALTHPATDSANVHTNLLQRSFNTVYIDYDSFASKQILSFI